MAYLQQYSARNLQNFGKRLTVYRQAAAISRVELADRVQVSQEHIWRLENGFRGCSRDLAIIIGQVLRLNVESINELLALAGHRPVNKKGGLPEKRSK